MSKPGEPISHEYVCTYCKMTCTLEGSKAASTKDPTKRYESVCLTTKRNMERRVKNRPASDPLCVWYKNLIKNNDLLAQWLRKMKKKESFARTTDEEHFAMTAEKDVEGIEERGRARYYGYDTIVFQNPGKSEEELIEIWKRAVAAAPSKIERDGKVSYDHNAC